MKDFATGAVAIKERMNYAFNRPRSDMGSCK